MIESSGGINAEVVQVVDQHAHETMPPNTSPLPEHITSSSLNAGVPAEAQPAMTLGVQPQSLEPEQMPTTPTVPQSDEKMRRLAATPRVEALLQSQGINISELPQDISQRIAALAQVKDETEFMTGFKSLLERVREESKNMGDKDRQVTEAYCTGLLNSIKSNRLTPAEAYKTLRGTLADAPEDVLPAQEKTGIQEALTDLEAELKKPKDKRDTEKVTTKINFLQSNLGRILTGLALSLLLKTILTGGL